MRAYLISIWLVLLLVTCGCISPKIKLFADKTDPLREFTLEGEAEGKVLVISAEGFISDAAKKGTFRSGPGMVDTLVSQLRKAEKDDEIRAVLLKINSPGGTASASDLICHEIAGFKKRTGAKVIAIMMDLAASGGYYISLPADLIMAHPTTITGSVGVIYMRPKVSGLMEKIGLEVEVNKSGKNKDMASLFRDTTPEETEIIQNMVNGLNERFLNLVTTHRKLDQHALSEISSARIYLAEEAKKLGLVDEIGYLSDAVLKAKAMAGLEKNAKVVVYRRTEYPDDTLYNTSMSAYGADGFSLIFPNLSEAVGVFHTGFYYLWFPGDTGS